MSLAKIIEVSGGSDRSFDDAVKAVYDEVSETVRGVQSVYVNELFYEPGHPAGAYRVHAKVTFVIESGQSAG